MRKFIFINVDANLNVAPSLDLTAFLNLFNCIFVNLQFILVYSTIYKFCKLNFSLVTVY